MAKKSADEISKINKANASHSKGPVTEEGKARSRRNALKHGLRAETLALPNEDPNELAAREDAFRAQYQPQNATEEVYLLEAVQSAIVLTRCARFQTATLSHQVRTAIPRVKIRNDDRIKALCNLLEKDKSTALEGLRSFAAGCAYLIEFWTDLRDCLKEHGHWHWTVLKKARLHGGIFADYVDQREEFPKKTEARTEALARIETILEELIPREAKLREVAEEADPAALQGRAMLFENPEQGALYLRYHGSALATFTRTTNALAKAVKERPAPPVAFSPGVLEAFYAAIGAPNEPKSPVEPPPTPCEPTASDDPPASEAAPALASRPAPKGAIPTLEEWLESNATYVPISAAPRSSQVAQDNAEQIKNL